MYVFGLLLKILYKLKLGNLIYPFFNMISHIFPNNKLPTTNTAKNIIYKNIYNRVRFDVSSSNILSNNYNLKKSNFNVQIIVPVYNSERYIKDCLNSIINQKTKYKFQIIVVNDGSTDSTSEILKQYNNNPLIKIINEKNLGRSVARNTGLNHVTSKYVMFVDSDDKLAPYAIENLLNSATKTNADIVFGGSIAFNNEGKSHINFHYTNNDFLKIKSDNDVDDSVWGKVFNSNLFTNIRFPVGYEFEDMMPAFWIYSRCHKMSSISNNVYYYRYNPSGVTHSFQFSRISIDSFLILSLIITSLQKYGISINQYIYNTFLIQVKTTCMRNIYINTKIQKSIFILLCNLYKKYFNRFSTDINYYKPLEYSLRNRDYISYILFCIMK